MKECWDVKVEVNAEHIGTRDVLSWLDSLIRDAARELPEYLELEVGRVSIEQNEARRQALFGD